jgi:hypothetical protein
MVGKDHVSIFRTLMPIFHPRCWKTGLRRILAASIDGIRNKRTVLSLYYHEELTPRDRLGE